MQFKPEEAIRIAANAANAGLTESQYVRHLALARLTTRAWWARPRTGPTVGDMRRDGIVHRQNRPNLPDYHLEVLTELGAGRASYRVFSESLQPMKVAWLEQHANYQDLQTGRLILGDSVLWKIVRTMTDSDTGQVIFTLEADHRGDTEPVMEAGTSQLCVIAPGATEHVRFGPLDVDRVVLINDPVPGTLFISSFSIGNRDRLIGGPMPASHLTQDIATVPKGSPVIIGLVNKGHVQIGVQITVR